MPRSLYHHLSHNCNSWFTVNYPLWQLSRYEAVILQVLTTYPKLFKFKRGVNKTENQLSAVLQIFLLGFIYPSYLPCPQCHYCIGLTLYNQPHQPTYPPTKLIQHPAHTHTSVLPSLAPHTRPRPCTLSRVCPLHATKQAGRCVRLYKHECACVRCV